MRRLALSDEGMASRCCPMRCAWVDYVGLHWQDFEFTPSFVSVQLIFRFYCCIFIHVQHLFTSSSLASVLCLRQSGSSRPCVAVTGCRVFGLRAVLRSHFSLTYLSFWFDPTWLGIWDFIGFGLVGVDSTLRCSEALPIPEPDVDIDHVRVW